MEETDKKITRRKPNKTKKLMQEIQQSKKWRGYLEEAKYFAQDKTLKCSVCLKADLIADFDRCPLCERKINHERKMVIG